MCDRCLGMLGGRSFKIWGVVSDRCLDVGVRSFKIGLCAIAVWGCGVRSFKIEVVLCDRFQKSVIIEEASDEKR